MARANPACESSSSLRISLRNSPGWIASSPRNRLKACEIAGIEPRFERLNGIDADTYILSLNIARRHMNKGQIAVLVAKVYPEPTKLKRAGSLKIKDQFPMVSAFALSQARTIVRYAPELADRVLANRGKTFSEAFELARQRKGEAESDAEKVERLRAEAPDLADLSGISLHEAMTLLEKRKIEAYPEAPSAKERGAMKGKSSLKIKEQFPMVSAFALSQARTIVRYARAPCGASVAYRCARH